MGSSPHYTGRFPISQVEITRAHPGLEWGTYHCMPWDWKIALEKELAARGLEMKELSLASGLGETGVRDMLKRTKNPGIDTVLAVARTLGKTLSELVEGAEPVAQQVPIVGHVSAGEKWVPLDDGVEYESMRIDGGEPIGVRVRGDSMAPVYRHGDLLVGPKRMEPPDKFVGKDCIVMTSQGERMLKFLARGNIRGRFNLRSYNPANKDIENVRLDWAAPIMWIRRA